MIEGLDHRRSVGARARPVAHRRDSDRRPPKRCRAGRRSTALLIQNTNPVSVAPEQTVVKRGFARDDLFACVHEQFMTETAQMADIVLPATMFLEHDDVYQRRRPPIHPARAEAGRGAGRVPHQSRGDLRRWRSALGAEHPASR